MNTWISQLINHFGYFAITALIALENIFPPLPSEVILALSGFLTLKTKLTLLGTILSATVGSLLGALLLYFIGYQVDEKRLSQFLTNPVLKKLGFKANDAQKAIDWFQRLGKKAVLIGRCIPIVRSLISLPAGSAHMPLGQFVVLTTLGSTVWNSILVLLGAYAGQNWAFIVTLFEDYTIVVLIIGIILLGLFIYRWYQTRLKK